MFVISSFSKYFNMTGWRLGWVVAPERHVRDLEKLAQNLYISPPTLSQRAALACFEPATLDVLESAGGHFRRGATSWSRRCANSASAFRCMPTGGFFVYADCSRFSHDSERSAATCLPAPASRSRPVSISAAIAPQQHVRFAYTIDEGKLEDGVARLACSLRASAHAEGRCSAAARPGAAGGRCDRRLGIAVAAMLSACASLTVEYYWQGARRAARHPRARAPIPEVIETTADAALAARLEQVQAIRATRAANSRSRTTAATRATPTSGGRSSLWNVFATPELSLEPRQWCFPIAGCVNYRGYFDEAAARREATRLKAARRRRLRRRRAGVFDAGLFRRSDPVDVRPLPATPSSRGWSFTNSRTRSLYVKDDTVFNESFAVTVEEVGVERWLAAQKRTRSSTPRRHARADRLRPADSFRFTLVRTTRGKRLRGSTRATATRPRSAPPR